jgi:broad specificity phosphatase PhoE
MSTELVFVTHSTSTDNEAGIASGHRDVSLSELGRRQAAELGERYRNGFDAVYCSDLRRAVETAEIAFASFRVDARLREQDYGERTGAPSREIETERLVTVDAPFPGGESLRDVVERMRSFVAELEPSRRALVIGHRATKIGFDVLLGRMTLEDAVQAPYVWQPGWTYEW